MCFSTNSEKPLWVCADQVWSRSATAADAAILHGLGDFRLAERVKLFSNIRYNMLSRVR
jgi:hypothetical protein